MHRSEFDTDMASTWINGWTSHFFPIQSKEDGFV